MGSFVAILIGGTMGCWARYLLTSLLQSLFGRGFPVATLTINVFGSFLMGLLFILTLERIVISPDLRTGILTGFLGGFTTFSTYAMEMLLLAERGEALKSVLYAGLSVSLGLAAAFTGAQLARAL